MRTRPVAGNWFASSGNWATGRREQRTGWKLNDWPAVEDELIYFWRSFPPWARAAWNW